MLLESYFRPHHLERLVRHQIESYNHFVGTQIQKTIEMFNPIHIKSEADYHKSLDTHALEVFVTFENFHLYRPQIFENNGAIKLMFPQEARLRNFTYSSAMTVDIHFKYLIREGAQLDQVRWVHKVLPKIHLGKLPIMLKSNLCVLTQYKHMDARNTGECKYDAGGYFIINGSEKTVLGQERGGENRIDCSYVHKSDPKYLWKADVRSVPPSKCISPKQLSMLVCAANDGFGHALVVQMPRVKTPLPLFVVFRALGVVSDRDICELIVLDLDSPRQAAMLDLLRASIMDANECLTTERAIRHIAANLQSPKPASVMAAARTAAAATAAAAAAAAALDSEKADGEKSAKEKAEEDARREDRKRQFVRDLLQNDLFPHCTTLVQKRYFLGQVASRLLQVMLGWRATDDRDACPNKRIDLVGVSLNNLFRNHLNTVVKDMERQIVKELKTGSWRSTEDHENIVNQTNIYKIVKSSTIENGFRRALSTGDFGLKNAQSGSKVGVAQVLSRLTYVASLSHLRRVSISTNTEKNGKLIPPRKLHPTSWGFLCPAETPEGPTVGIVKNLSYMTHVTIPSAGDPSLVLGEYLRDHLVPLETLVSPAEAFQKVKVMVNGAWLGVARDPVGLYAHLKELKLRGVLNVYTSVVLDCPTQEIRVCTDGGRVTRPLLRVANRRLVLTAEHVRQLRARTLAWDDLLLSGGKLDEAAIEYVDPEEQAHAMIATHPDDLRKNPRVRYTHCEIHPSTIFGVIASCIPFPDHNQSPRNCYQCAQAKQAMGMYATNFHERMDKTGYVQTYLARPLVDTRVMGMLKLHEIPSGYNIVVAIMTYTGYNQEDSLLINKAAVDRGLFQITLTHTEKDEDKQKINGDEEIRCRPNPAKTKGMKFGNYGKVNAKGVMPENERVENGDIIIAKVTPIKENKNDPTKLIKYEDGSKHYKTSEETYVDKNYIDKNGDGYTFAKVRLRTTRKPVIGDKFSSRHGQKGTAGNLIAEEDMPFTASGLRPDLILNPHAIPSRMTIGHTIETQLGKVLLELGLFGDGTSFGSLTVEAISDLLLERGFEAYGNELLYDGQTGRQLQCSVFMGPVFYQRLKHMVNDKQHSRSIGPTVKLTRQPKEGRANDGGLKFGEMERDCMVSHGAMRFLRERFYDVSDKYVAHACRRCGLLAAYNDQMNIYLCRTCDNRADFAKVELPYACKLMFQELTTMNVAPRLLTT